MTARGWLAALESTLISCLALRRKTLSHADGAHLLPDALRRTLDPLWQAGAALTRIFAGTTAGIDPPFGEHDARLIDMPSSRLTGPTFGDLSRWCITIPPEALGTGQFDQADALSAHGVF